MDMLVLGAGIIGLATAHALRRDGHAVTVVDAQPEVGMGASRGNAGQLSYRYVAPLADPDALRQLPAWLLRRDSPVRFRPRLDPAQWRWLLSFLGHCTTRDKQRTVADLLPLALLSQQVLGELMAGDAVRFDHARTGKLVIHRDRRAFAAARRMVEANPQLAQDQQVLDAAGCVALEPALADIAPHLAGGIYTPADESGDCRRLCQTLAAWLAKGPNPVHIALGRHVHGLAIDGGRIVGAHTSEGWMAAQAVVVAGGMAAMPLLRRAGLRLPVYPIKGYSVTIPLTRCAAAPVVNVTDHRHRIVYASLGADLRIAGMADIGDTDARIDPRRVRTLLDHARTTFGIDASAADASPWAGLRPATPHGRPIIGQTGIRGLWLNTGHGALGFTLALGSAQVLADQMAGRPPVIADAAFRPDATRYSPTAAPRRAVATPTH